MSNPRNRDGEQKPTSLRDRCSPLLSRGDGGAFLFRLSISRDEHEQNRGRADLRVQNPRGIPGPPPGRGLAGRLPLCAAPVPGLYRPA